MVKPDNIIQNMADRFEIQDILILYCTAIDSKQYDRLNYVFSEEAIVDYTSAGGIRGSLSEAIKWLSEVLTLFDITQHVVGNFVIDIDGDQATSRCSFYNPMGLKSQDKENPAPMFFVGGYYNDKLLRTSNGWRIIERIEESTWNYGLPNSAIT